MNILTNENIEKIKALELSNYIDTLEQDFLNGDGGYYKKLGKDALHDSSKMSGGALDELRKFEAEINKKVSELGSFNSVILNEIKNKKLEMLKDNLLSHERNQFINWINSTIKQGIELAIKKAVLHRESRDEIEKIIQNGKVIIIQKGIFNESPKKLIQEEICLFENEITKEILDSYGIDGNLKIIDFFEDYKKNLNEDEIKKYSKIVDETKEKYFAGELASRVFALFSNNRGQAKEEIKKENGDKLSSELLNSYFVLADRRCEKEQNELLSQMFQEISNAQKNFEPFQYNILPYKLNDENKKQAMEYLKKKMNGEKIETNEKDFFFLFDKFLKGELADYNFIKFKMTLCEFDFKLFMKLQELSRDLTFGELQDYRDVFCCGIDKIDFLRCVLDDFLSVKKIKKEALNYDEMREIIKKRLSRFENSEQKDKNQSFFGSLKTVFKRE